MADDTNAQRSVEDGRFFLFHTLWSIASIVLALSTWRLWIATDNFPQIPLLRFFVGTPIWIDYVALFVCGAASLLIVAALFGRRTTVPKNLIGPKLRFACLIWAVALAILFATNQHRLQPWAWQYFVFAILVVLSATQQFCLAASRTVVLSVYLWSAIGKFDYQFLNGLGRQFVGTITNLIGSPIPTNDISPWAVALLPAGELLVGLLLIFPVCRRFGVAAAVSFHLSLVVILGPWAMDHHLGVVIWNCFFALSTAVLFWPERKQAESQTAQAIAPPKLLPHAASIALTALVVAMPIYPHCDHWLAWGLYSPSNRRCSMKVIATPGLQELDDSLQRFLIPIKDELVGGLEFYEVDTGKMSLELLGAPIYPEARMQLGVCQWINARGLRDRAMITVQSKSDRWTGERQSTHWEPMEAQGESTQFFFNHLPRSSGQ